MSGTPHEFSAVGDVSVVVPTVGRTTLCRAVQSALTQEPPVLEVIIAADTAADLDLPDDPRVRVVRVGPGAGGNVARQAGAQAARGDLVALLDDDDVWLPGKMAAQLADIATELDGDTGRPWVATTPVRVVYGDGAPAEVWPEVRIGAQDNLAEYVLRKTRVIGGQGFVQASTLVFPRRLTTTVPFDPARRFHQDLHWLVEVDRVHPDVMVVQTAHPLVEYHVPGGSGTTVSGRITAEESTAWALENLDHVSARARGDFLLTTPVTFARRRRDLRGVVSSTITGLRSGRPGLPARIYALASLALALGGLGSDALQRGRRRGADR